MIVEVPKIGGFSDILLFFKLWVYKGMERWLSGYEHMLLLQKPRFFPSTHMVVKLTIC